uniref:Hyaluronidase n=1 Tax=Onchocerca volvulus TaxID=6282 RepID=A0A8R1U063_ONCVO
MNFGVSRADGAITFSTFDDYLIIWNVPSEKCAALSKTNLLKRYGILVNSGHKFLGEVIVVFYEEKFGLLPYYHNYSDPKSAVNGGIPQRANISAHLSVVRNNISKQIPDANFSGLAVIDYEKWRPLWDLHNYYKLKIYQNESIAHVKTRNNGISESNAKKIAMDEFNNASVNFLLETIREAKKLRPNATWGFYGMPFCNYSAGKSGYAGCGTVYEKFNDRLEHLYKEVDALFPSIYIPHRGSNVTSCLYVGSVLTEAGRCAKKVKPEIPTYPYVGFEYFPINLTNPFYTRRDLRNSLGQAFYVGAKGSIIWSTSKNMTERCISIAQYVEDSLGPEIANLPNLTSAKTAKPL